ncbi:hypothetical protein CYY_004913 [Polysphondylium violaceum]|uniref:Uncharacterized protein n=1 Tax=Polysphondylium violaceum TaxID=133409 RepID=A0A8J4PXC7_9MYCE|nr:hypothetical protein CYY_004913 [Polysphondylium violaceum]
MSSLNDHIEWSSDFIYFNKWTSSSPGKTVYIERDNGLPMTRDFYGSVSSVFSQQIIYLAIFLLLIYISF